MFHNSVVPSYGAGIEDIKQYHFYHARFANVIWTTEWIRKRKT
jgi:hypothetical protein